MQNKLFATILFLIAVALFLYLVIFNPIGITKLIMAIATAVLFIGAYLFYVQSKKLLNKE